VPRLVGKDGAVSIEEGGRADDALVVFQMRYVGIGQDDRVTLAMPSLR
jgi:hypothetical protein